MRTTWEAKSMRGIRTLRPDQSVIADTLALKASSWFVRPCAWGVNRSSSFSVRRAAPSTVS